MAEFTVDQRLVALERVNAFLLAYIANLLGREQTAPTAYLIDGIATGLRQLNGDADIVALAAIDAIVLRADAMADDMDALHSQDL